MRGHVCLRMHVYVCVQACMHTSHSTHVEVKGQESILSQGSCASNPGHWAWRQASLSAELFPQPSTDTMFLKHTFLSHRLARLALFCVLFCPPSHIGNAKLPG